MEICTEIQEAVVATKILAEVRFVPGYVPELLTYQATQATPVAVMATSPKWSAL